MIILSERKSAIRIQVGNVENRNKRQSESPVKPDPYRDKASCRIKESFAWLLHHYCSTRFCPADFVTVTGLLICRKSILGRQMVSNKDPARVFGAAEFGN